MINTISKSKLSLSILGKLIRIKIIYIREQTVKRSDKGPGNLGTILHS